MILTKELVTKPSWIRKDMSFKVKGTPLAAWLYILRDNGAHIGLEPKGKFEFLLKQHGINFDEIPDFSAAISGNRKIVPIDTKPKVKGS